MTPHEREYFAAGFAYAFMIAAGVQRQAFGHLGDCLGELEQTVGHFESRPQRFRRVRRLVPAGYRNGQPLYRVANW